MFGWTYRVSIIELYATGICCPRSEAAAANSTTWDRAIFRAPVEIGALNVLAEEGDHPIPCQLCSLGVIPRRRIVVEAVARTRVCVHLVRNTG